MISTFRDLFKKAEILTFLYQILEIVSKIGKTKLNFKTKKIDTHCAAIFSLFCNFTKRRLLILVLLNPNFRTRIVRVKVEQAH